MSFRVVPFRTQGVCAALAVLGTILTGVFVARKVKGAMLLGMLSTWALGIAAQSAGVYVPDPAAGYFSLYPEIALSGVSGSFREFGATAGALFDPASWTHGSGEAMRSGWALVRSVDFLVVVFAFFFMDLFDTLGTLIGVSIKADLLDRDGRLPRITGALCADAVATSVGAALGTSTTTTYMESAAGVAAGGRTGLTAVAAAVLFAAAVFFAPVFLAVPAFATAPALVVVGYMMISSVADIDWKDPGEGLPAFVALAWMPFTYSISDGIMFGIIFYTVINALAGRFSRLHWIMYVLTAVFLAKYALM